MEVKIIGIKGFKENIFKEFKVGCKRLINRNLLYRRRDAINEEGGCEQLCWGRRREMLQQGINMFDLKPEEGTGVC